MKFSYSLTVLVTVFVAATSAITAEKDKKNGDCALGNLNTDANGVPTSCGNGVISL